MFATLGHFIRWIIQEYPTLNFDMFHSCSKIVITKSPRNLWKRNFKITMAMTGFMKCFVPKKARVFLSLQFQENLKLTPVNLTPSTYKPPRHFGAGISPFFLGGTSFYVQSQQVKQIVNSWSVLKPFSQTGWFENMGDFSIMLDMLDKNPWEKQWECYSMNIHQQNLNYISRNEGWPIVIPWRRVRKCPMVSACESLANPTDRHASIELYW